MILKAENISFDYSTGYPCGGHVRRKIFDGFDFAVKSGERVGGERLPFADSLQAI